MQRAHIKVITVPIKGPRSDFGNKLKLERESPTEHENLDKFWRSHSPIQENKGREGSHK
jgi:hypothetical protein